LLAPWSNDFAHVHRLLDALDYSSFPGNSTLGHSMSHNILGYSALRYRMSHKSTGIISCAVLTKRLVHFTKPSCNPLSTAICLANDVQGQPVQVSLIQTLPAEHLQHLVLLHLKEEFPQSHRLKHS
jgi:hypothetical protein